MEDHGLELVIVKTEIVLLTKRCINTESFKKVKNTTVQTKKAIKNLGVIFDTKLTCGKQILNVADEAVAVTTIFSRIMANAKYF